MESIGLGTEDEDVLKSANDIKSSSILSMVGNASTGAEALTGSGNGSNGSTCRLAVPGSIVERMVDWQIISPLFYVN